MEVAGSMRGSKAALMWGYPQKTGNLSVLEVESGSKPHRIRFRELASVLDISGMSGGPITDVGGNLVGVLHGFGDWRDKSETISTAAEIRGLLRQLMASNR